MHRRRAAAATGVGVRKTRARRGGCTRTPRVRGHAGRRRRLRAARRGRGRRWDGRRRVRRGARRPRRRRQLAAKEKGVVATRQGTRGEQGGVRATEITVADLRGAIREHEKEAARLRGGEGAAARVVAKGAGADRARVYAQHEPHQQQIQLLQLFRPVRGVGAVRDQGTKPRGDGERDGERDGAAPAPSRTVSGAPIKSAGEMSGALSSVFGKLTMGGAKRAVRRAVEKESSRRTPQVSSASGVRAATSRARLRREERDAVGGAESDLREEICSWRNSRGRSGGPGSRDRAADADRRRDGGGARRVASRRGAGGGRTGGELGPGARGARHENGAADAPTRRRGAAPPSPGSGNAR